MNTRKIVRIHTRKIDRLVAKAKIHNKGMSNTCKKNNLCLSPRCMKKQGRSRLREDHYGRSYFSDNWRKIAGLEA